MGRGGSWHNDKIYFEKCQCRICLSLIFQHNAYGIRELAMLLVNVSVACCFIVMSCVDFAKRPCQLFKFKGEEQHFGQMA